jgi:hypothetical protein
MLFNYTCWAGSLADLRTGGGEATVKVVKGKHQFSTHGNAVTDVEAVKI